jgi:hypothetical protein
VLLRTKRKTRPVPGTAPQKYPKERWKRKRKDARASAITHHGDPDRTFYYIVIVMNSSLLYAVLPAVKVGGESFTSAEYDFFYLSDFNQFYSNASSYSVRSSTPRNL